MMSEDGGGASGTGAEDASGTAALLSSAPGRDANDGAVGRSETVRAFRDASYGFEIGEIGDEKNLAPYADAPSRVRRRPVDDDFVVMSTPKGLRRVPSARKIRSAQGARPGGQSIGNASREGHGAEQGHGVGGVGGVGGGAPGSPFGGGAARREQKGASDETAAAGARRQKPTRASSASGARASIETARRVEMLQRPPSRQRPPPEAVDLFARGRAAAAAAAAAPAVPGLNKVSRPAGMAASMLRM
jgi:hypothetical protein